MRGWSGDTGVPLRSSLIARMIATFVLLLGPELLGLGLLAGLEGTLVFVAGLAAATQALALPLAASH